MIPLYVPVPTYRAFSCSADIEAPPGLLIVGNYYCITYYSTTISVLNYCLRCMGSQRKTLLLSLLRSWCCVFVCLLRSKPTTQSSPMCYARRARTNLCPFVVHKHFQNSNTVHILIVYLNVFICLTD